MCVLCFDTIHRGKALVWSDWRCDTVSLQHISTEKTGSKLTCTVGVVKGRYFGNTLIVDRSA